MNNKLSFTCLILMILPLIFGCHGPVKEKTTNNASTSSLSLQVRNEKYVAIDTNARKMTTITSVVSIDDEHKNITGNLTIKGITHAVTFPAKMEVKDGTVKANGKLVIDRTKWDVRYDSGRFFDNLADKAISDSIEFDVTIVTKK